MKRTTRSGPEESAVASAPAWFCLRAQPKHEHIAAAHLRPMAEVEVFLPRIRFRRATRVGAQWVTEALFPGYLFARFNWEASRRRVVHARGVRNVVHFGPRWPTIPAEVIQSLREQLSDHEVHCVPEELAPGTEVRLVGGAFHGLLAVVSRPLPGRERVAVLLDFLGRQTCLEVPLVSVVPEDNPRQQL
jgi:transcriptional antiterminator RfaH